jgi:hypothetical protein
MTESDWDESNDPREMLAFLQSPGRASERKLALISIACCRRLRIVREDPDLRAALAVVERFADGLASDEERERTRSMAEEIGGPSYLTGMNEEKDSWSAVAMALAGEAGMAASMAVRVAILVGTDMDNFHESSWKAMRAEWAAQCVLLREIFGVLHRPAVIDQSWVTPAVTKLAEAAYASWDPDLFPVLGDALEAAGCTDPEVLGHARGGGGHVRGCWLVDGLLGKV